MCKKVLSLFLTLSVLFVGLPVANVMNVRETASAEEVSKAENTTSEKSRPKVSVVVPVYNVESWIRECLDSIKNQTLKEIEIICVDDGSSDNCGKILDEYAANDSRFIVIHQENKGVQEARNAGLNIASGEYITFVDSDDYLQLEAYEVAYNAAIGNNVDILQFGYNSFEDGNEKQINENVGTKDLLICDFEAYLKKSVVRSRLFVWNKLFKYDLVKKDNVKFMKEIKPADDACFSFMVLGRAKSIKIIPGKFYNYRLREGAITAIHKKSWFVNSYKMLKFICNDWRSYGLSNGREHLLLTLLVNWGVCSPVRLQYAYEILDFFGPDIYNPETVKKCDEQTQKLIRELEYAAQYPEKFQNSSSEANNNIKKTASLNQKVNRLQRKVAA